MARLAPWPYPILAGWERRAVPPRADVILVSPAGPGRVLRAAFRRGDRLPAYVGWAQYERNLARLAANRARASSVLPGQIVDPDAPRLEHPRLG